MNVAAFFNSLIQSTPTIRGKRRREEGVTCLLESLEARTLLSADFSILQAGLGDHSSDPTATHYPLPWQADGQDVGQSPGSGHFGGAASGSGEEDDDKETDPADIPVEVTGAFLTSQEEGDSKAAYFDDVIQGFLDSCVFTAALSGAARKAGELSSRISVQSQSGNTTTYKVQLYSLNAQNQYVVNTRTVVFDNVVQPEDPRVADNQEFWATIYQRAYLDLASSLGQNYHSMNFALSSLLGASTSNSNVSSSLSTAQLIKSSLEAGKVIIGSTPNTASFFVNSQYGIVHNHAYTILGIEIPNGTDLANAYVSIRNPWGHDTSLDFFDEDHNGSIDWGEYADSTYGVDGSNDGLIRVSWSAFASSFDQVAINSLAGANLNTPLPANKSVHFDSQPGPFTIFEGERLEVNLHATDPEGEFVFYSVVTPSGYIQIQTGAFSWEPPANSAGTHVIRVKAEVSPYESATMSFVVNVKSGIPRIGSLVAAPTTLHDDGSELLTLTANNVVTDLGKIYDVEFWRDVDGNQTFDPNIDFLLGDVPATGSATFSWSGYLGGLSVGNQTFFARARRFSSYNEFWSLPAPTTVNVIPSPHIDPVAIPTGDQKLITDSAANQRLICVRSDSAGNFYELLEQYIPLPAPASSFSILLLRKLDAAGNEITVFQLPWTDPNHFPGFFDLVVQDDGSFAVARYLSSGTYGHATISLYRFDANGQMTAGNTVVSEAWAQNEYLTAAGDKDGNILIAYNVGDYLAEDIWAVSVSKNNVVTRAPWRVSLNTDGSQKYPTVSLNKNGDGVIAYTDVANGQIRFRKISSYGLGNGQDDFVVQYAEPDTMITSAVSNTGEFYIGWSQGTDPNDSIMVRKFDATGVAMGLPFKANTFGGGRFSEPSITVSDSGWFTVAWNNSTQDGTLHNDYGVYAQLFDLTGAKIGPEFAGPNQRDYSQVLSKLFMDSDADISFFWHDDVYYYAGTGTWQFRSFNVDLPPQFGTNAPFTIPENSPAGTSVGTVSASDPDPGSTLAFELQGDSPFQINTQTGEITVANNAALDFETQPSYVLSVRVTSGAKFALGTIQINLSNVNETPSLTLNSGTYVYTPGGVPVRFADPFVLTDLDSPNFYGGKIRAAYTLNGTVDDRIGFSSNLGVTVNQGDVTLNGLVVGIIVSSGQGTTPFEVSLNDNATLNVVQTLLNSLQFEVLANPTSLLTRRIALLVNDGELNSSLVFRDVTVANNSAPILNNTGNPVLTPIAEDVPLASNTGTLISQIIASMSPDGGITDPNPGAKQGIAITVPDQTNGTWQFTTNGTTWTNFGTLSVTNTLLLASDANTRVRFLPNPDFNSTSKFVYVAWDQSAGTNGSTMTATARGGTKPFSLDYDTAILTINPTNDAPVLGGTTTVSLGIITEDTPATSLFGIAITQVLSNFTSNSGTYTDIDAGALKGIAVTSVENTNGTWEYTINAGTTWLPFGTPTASAARLLASAGGTRLRFIPKPNFDGLPTFNFVAWDQTEGTNGGTAVVTNRGGSKPFSLAVITGMQVIESVNDAPLLNNAGNPTLTAINQNVPLASNTGTLISSLIASMAPNGNITDIDANAKQGIAIYGANSTNGNWQYTTNGTTWVDFATINVSNSLLLASDTSTRIRFVPKANFNGTAGINFVAWDQTTGTNGSKVAVSPTGGNTAFSSATETALITVIPVANSPAAIGIFRNGQFYLDANNNGVWNSSGDSFFAFGNSTDTPLVGDWNGDGKTDIGVWRNGTFYLDLNGNRKWDASDTFFTFGNPTDKPITGDWNGDGKTDVGTFRNGTFFLDANGSRKWEGAADVSFNFGNSTDLPITGDWNGDGKTDVGTFRNGTFYLDANGSRKWESANDLAFLFGNPTDLPVTGDWNADGKTDVGTFRNGSFFLDYNGSRKWEGATDKVYNFGIASDKPLAGAWPSATAPASLIVANNNSENSLANSTSPTTTDSSIAKIKTNLLKKLKRAWSKGKSF